MQRFRHLTAMLIASAATLAVAAAEARELIYGSWLGAKATTNTIGMQRYLDAVNQATNGEIQWQLVAGGQLVTGTGTVEAVRTGMIDAGIAMAPYTPKDLPATNLIFNTTVMGDDTIAAAGAMNETILLHCPECLEEYQRNNAVAFIGEANSPYLIMCRAAVATVADLKGLKVRSSGGGVKIMQFAGATPVAMNPAEATTALERGALDCVLGGVAWLRNFGYMDVVTTVLDHPMGMGGPPLMMFINRDVWTSLTPDQRKAHVDQAAFLVAHEVINAQLRIDEEVKAEAKRRGITFVKGGDDFAAVMKQREDTQRAENIAVAREHGVKDPEAIVDAFDAMLEKWRGLSPKIGMDVARFQAVLQREIYDKIDPEKL